MAKNDPLKHLRIQVAAAEAGLTRARANMREQAVKLGLPTAGIFSESEFVSRTTAERWVGDARAEVRAARAEVRAEMKDVIAAISATPKSSRAPRREDTEDPKVFAAKIIAAGKKARGEK